MTAQKPEIPSLRRFPPEKRRKIINAGAEALRDFEGGFPGQDEGDVDKIARGTYEAMRLASLSDDDR